MSFAPQNQAPDVTDVIDGSITSWYDNINNCLKTSECVPGHYEYTQAPCYGTQCPIHEGASTKIDVGCSRFEIVDLNNSYIDAEFTFQLKYPNQSPEGFVRNKDTMYYIGFKSSYDLIDQYRIYSNGDLIYTQNHANYEGFLNYLSLTDSAKENSPCFATMNKIRNRSSHVPGTYIFNNDSTDDHLLNITLNLKIPLNAFPILQHLKYFPGFMGKLQIEIYPSYKNLVWANITADHIDNFSAGVVTNLRPLNQSEDFEPPELLASVDSDIRDVLSFYQINSPAWNRYDTPENDVESHVFGFQTFVVSTSTLTRFHLYQAVYMIKIDVYNALEMNYLQIPLLFPIQTIETTYFTSSIKNASHFTLQNAATLTHSDTVFIVFPNTQHDRTVSYNPEIKAHLSINGKYYPREQVSTAKNDVRFRNLVYDALNINNNPLMTPGDDIANSMNPYIQYTNLDEDSDCVYEAYETNKGDHSNFIFAVPLSTDEDFMGGISSNGSTVQIELIGTRDSLSESINAAVHDQPPVALFLEDKIMKIYSMKPPGKPQIQITNATLEQIVASGGSA